MLASDSDRAATPVQGLSSAEAARRLEQYGTNAVAEAREHPWLAFLQQFWTPVPWMLEATIALQIALGKADEAAIIFALLLFNAVLSFVQQHRANQALDLLKRRLTVSVRALRDGRWQILPAPELVPGDVVHLRMGDLTPADIRLLEGALLLDTSALTGESLPVEASQGATVFAGSMVRRGEATGEVAAIGPRTYFGKTAELVRTARTESHLASLILNIVKHLVTLDAALVLMLFIYAIAVGLPLHELLPFALMLLVASVPLALPATFTLATALGAQELARCGVLVTRLSAIEEAATMDVLATDKTGTITENRLSLAELTPNAAGSKAQLLRLAALACDEATQDPIDLAILAAARARGVIAKPRRTSFRPFDPATKRSEAEYEEAGMRLWVVKGAPKVVAAMVPEAPPIGEEVERLAAEGCRVLAVAASTGGPLRLSGLLALEDPPRGDSVSLVQSLRALGLRVIMVTGDGLATAQTIARRVGIGTRACPPEVLRGEERTALDRCDVYAGVLPEDKFYLVKGLQRAGHVTGMTGDGVNDAPALKQAEVGIAVANATDVAKAAASLVLTYPGLSNVVAAVEESRRIYRRMLTYTLNKIIKTLQAAFFLSIGVMATGVFVVTPLLIVLLLFANDFVTMSIATDHAPVAPQPVRWRVRTLVLAIAALAIAVLAFSLGVFFAARDALHLPLPQLQTLAFLLLVFSGQGTVYMICEHGHFWCSRPSRWLLIAMVGDIAVVGLLAAKGILMAPLNLLLMVGLLLQVLGYLVLLDFLKVRLFRALRLTSTGAPALG